MDFEWTRWLSDPVPMTGAVVLILAAPIIGSFLGLVAMRLPAGRPIVFTRSACDACGQVLGARDLIPLFSFAARGGRCAHCLAQIPVRLPLIEAGAFLIALWALAALGPGAPWGLVLASLGLGYALIVLTAIDAEHFILPDVITLPLILAGLAVTWAFHDERLLRHALGAMLGYGSIWGIGMIYRMVRGRDGIGLGDAKLMAAAGAWCGPLALPSVMLLGAVSGLLGALGLRLAGRAIGPSTALPFGPALSLGFWITWLHGPVRFGF